MSDCCEIDRSETVSVSDCPECGNKGKKVGEITLLQLLTDESIPLIQDVQYYFCQTPRCEVVYFSNDACQRFQKSDIRVRVGVKETEDPIPVCYCFNFTEKMISDEIALHQKTTIRNRIRAEVTAGNCECEIKNPEGSCCLGDVGGVVKKATKLHKAVAEHTAPLDRATNILQIGV